jgi:hypothetical protein
MKKTAVGWSEQELNPEWEVMADVLRVGESSGHGWGAAGKILGLSLLKIGLGRRPKDEFDSAVLELDAMVRGDEIEPGKVVDWLDRVLPWWTKMVPVKERYAFVCGLIDLRSTSHDVPPHLLGKRKRTRKANKDHLRS